MMTEYVGVGEIMASPGEFLKHARKSKGLTQEQVAEELNVVAPVLSKWENDKGTPSLGLLCRLCNILSISLEDCVACGDSGYTKLPPEYFDAQSLGRNIRHLRNKNGWSQAEVGKMLFVSSQTVSKWECGAVSSLNVLCGLSRAFGVSPTELISGCGGAEFSADEAQVPAPDAGARLAALATPQQSRPSAVAVVRPKRARAVAIIIIAAILMALIIFSVGTGFGGYTGGVSSNASDSAQGGQSEQESGAGFNDIIADDGGVPPASDSPSQAVLRNPIESDQITAGYEFWYNRTLDKYHFHAGIDFSAAAGSPVCAVADGTVSEIISDDPLRKYVKINHGGISALYAYIDCASDIYVGKSVLAGEVIGAVSEPYGEEFKEGPHLHFEIHVNDEPVDPDNYLGLQQT